MYTEGDQPKTPTFKSVGEPERGYAILSQTIDGA
jgi:hypothetical protein